MATIYKRFKGSGAEDLTVAAGIVGAGSVDQAFKEKHHRGGSFLLKNAYLCVYINFCMSVLQDF